jgi:eukaryotic-like serine/threonine-protein kinase
MTSERWRQIEELYHRALELKPSRRAAFLREACAGDRGLQEEVERLLTAEQQAGSFLEEPAFEGAARELAQERPTADTADDAPPTQLGLGAQLGPYRIETRLGAGGMGEVFRAMDTRLGRKVAIKVCAQQFTERFGREARAISALNHPHICTLYDIGHNYLVMEFVEGETLAARLEKGPLPLEFVLRYGTEIADALAAAHAQGITHRDLKPANIMVTKSGVKVLDFGLAKIARPAGTPTKHSESLTASQAVLGTLGYMAPEQLEGKDSDARSDIFSLGLVLYEMATGRKAFTGDSQAALIAEVMRCRPAPMESLSEKFTHVVERSLARDPDDRWQTAKDVKAELSWASKGNAAGQVTAPRKLPTWIWGFASGLIAVGLWLGWTVVHLRMPAETRTFRFAVNPPPGTEFHVDSGVTISPDGRLLAFVSASSGGAKLWIRPLNAVAARELPGTEQAFFPFWSPDSRSLGFFAAGKLKRIEVVGGLPTLICDVGTGRGASWNDEGTILFSAVNDGPLMKVSASGGTPIAVTNIDATQRENSHRWPQFLPNGRRFLYFSRSENPGVYLGSLDNAKEKIRLLSSPASAVYAPDPETQSGHLFWVRDDGALMVQAFDPERDQLTGEAVLLSETVAFEPATRLAAVSVSNDKTLLYSGAEIGSYQLTWYGREGKSLGLLGQAQRWNGLRISPDSKRVALNQRGNVWQMEFARGIATRVGTGSFYLSWSPDSQQIVYVNGAPPNLFSRSANGSGPEERLIESQNSLTLQDWSLDGKFLLYEATPNDLSLKTQSDFWLLPMGGDRKPIPFMTTPFRELRGQFSPDGKWIAYTSDESGRDEVYVQSFPISGFKAQVSSKGGDWVRWRKDGTELFYVAPDRKLMAVAVGGISSSLEFATPTALFALPVMLGRGGDTTAPYTYDVMPDGQRFLALAPTKDAEKAPMTVILNWKAELYAVKK